MADMNKHAERMEDLSTDELTELWILAEGRPEFREQARVVLQERIAQGAFTLEAAATCAGRVVNVWFVATTPAFEQYGRYVTGCFINPTIGALQMLEAAGQRGSTKGMVQFAGIDDHLTPEKKADLKNVGFHTNDVLRLTF